MQLRSEVVEVERPQTLDLALAERLAVSGGAEPERRQARPGGAAEGDPNRVVGVRLHSGCLTFERQPHALP